MLHLDKNWFENSEARPHPRPGRTWLEPILWVDDLEGGLDFYHHTMGLVPILICRDEEKKAMFARLRYRGMQFCLSRKDFDNKAMPLGSTSSFLFYLYVDDIGTTVAKMTGKGSQILIPEELTSWGDNRARIQDPFGIIWDLVQTPS